jgi:hypothetical protein
VSWLLVVFIPGLLMLATFGLGRLESSLARDTVSASDVAEFLQQAKAHDVDRLARDGMSEALDGIHRRLAERDPANDTLPTRLAQPSLPKRVYIEHSPNPQFQATRHANRV